MLMNTEELEKQLLVSKEEQRVAATIVKEYFNGRPVTDEDITCGVFENYQKQYTAAKQKTEELQNRITEKRRKAASIQRFIKQIQTMDNLFEEFTPQLWTGLCDHMTVYADGRITVTFKSGTEITI